MYSKSINFASFTQIILAYLKEKLGEGYTRKWIYWGILWNSEIDKVLLNKREARTIDIKNYKIRISYTVGEDCSGKLPPNQELIFR